MVRGSQRAVRQVVTSQSALDTRKCPSSRLHSQLRLSVTVHVLSPGLPRSRGRACPHAAPGPGPQARALGREGRGSTGTCVSPQCAALCGRLWIHTNTPSLFQVRRQLSEMKSHVADGDVAGAPGAHSAEQDPVKVRARPGLRPVTDPRWGAAPPSLPCPMTEDTVLSRGRWPGRSSTGGTCLVTPALCSFEWALPGGGALSHGCSKGPEVTEVASVPAPEPPAPQLRGDGGGRAASS